MRLSHLIGSRAAPFARPCQKRKLHELLVYDAALQMMLIILRDARACPHRVGGIVGGELHMFFEFAGEVGKVEGGGVEGGYCEARGCKKH